MSLNLFPRLWISSRMTRSPFVICRRYLSDSKIPKPAEFSKRRVKEDSSKGKGPVSWVNAIVSGVALSAVIGTYLYVKDIKTKELDKERKREIGKSKIGGQFKLFDTKIQNHLKISMANGYSCTLDLHIVRMCVRMRWKRLLLS